MRCIPSLPSTICCQPLNLPLHTTLLTQKTALLRYDARLNHAVLHSSTLVGATLVPFQGAIDFLVAPAYMTVVVT